MSATNVAVQHRHRCVHLLTDMAVYDRDGVVVDFTSKATPVDHWPGAMSGRGNAYALAQIAGEVANSFASFDYAVEKIEGAFPTILSWLPEETPRDAELVIAGWSAQRQRPEAYVIHATSELPPGSSAAIAQARATGADVVLPQGAKLQRLPDLVFGPVPTSKMAMAAHYDGIDVDDEPENVIAGLRFIIEMQRHDKFDGALGDGHVIGGGAELTTITPEGIEQRLITEWPEDTIGQQINPRPISWTQWRAENYPIKAKRERKPSPQAHCQYVSMLGNLATVEDTVRAKEASLKLAYDESGVSLGGMHDAVINAVRANGDWQLANEKAAAGVYDFGLANKAAAETLQLWKDKGLIHGPDELAASIAVLDARTRSLKETAENANPVLRAMYEQQFELAQLGRTPAEQSAASSARGLYPAGNDYLSHLNDAVPIVAKLNEAIESQSEPAKRGAKVSRPAMRQSERGSNERVVCAEAA